MTETRTYKSENTFNNYLAKTFSIVTIGVVISAILAFISSKIMPYFMATNPGLSLILSFGLIIGELAVAIYFSTRLNNMSQKTAWVCYILYSVLTGLSFSTIVMSYTDASVTLAFVSTAIMFACMSFIGYTSNFDFTKIYSLFLPALIAGLIVSLLNAFLIHSPQINMLIVYLGLILFLVITAADIQRLKSYYYLSQNNEELSNKLMIMGAFQLYLDFVNMFIKILQIFGRRRRD